MSEYDDGRDGRDVQFEVFSAVWFALGIVIMCLAVYGAWCILYEPLVCR